MDRTAEVEKLAHDYQEADATMADAAGYRPSAWDELSEEARESFRVKARTDLARLPADMPMDTRIVCTGAPGHGCDALCPEPCNTLTRLPELTITQGE